MPSHHPPPQIEIARVLAGLLVLAASASGCSAGGLGPSPPTDALAPADTLGAAVRVAASPDGGFSSPYYLYVPPALRSGSQGRARTLLVLPNNTGTLSDDPGASDRESGEEIGYFRRTAARAGVAPPHAGLPPAGLGRPRLHPRARPRRAHDGPAGPPADRPPAPGDGRRRPRPARAGRRRHRAPGAPPRPLRRRHVRQPLRAPPPGPGQGGLDRLPRRLADRAAPGVRRAHAHVPRRGRGPGLAGRPRPRRGPAPCGPAPGST